MADEMDDLEAELIERWPKLEGVLSKDDLESLGLHGLRNLSVVEAVVKSPDLLEKAGLSLATRAVLREPPGDQQMTGKTLEEQSILRSIMPEG